MRRGRNTFNLTRKSATISSIEEFGYFWLGFGMTLDLHGKSDSSSYSGHSFCVSMEYVELDN